MKNLQLVLPLAALLLAIAPAEGENIGSVRAVIPDGPAASFQCDHGVVRLELWSDSMLRIWMNPAGKFDYYNGYNSYTIEPGLKLFNSHHPLKFANAGGQLQAQTAEMRIEIDTNLFRISIYRLPDDRASSTFVMGKKC